MKPIPSSATRRRRSNGFNRFLRPGALAQIRNSKIIARSHSHSLVSLTQIPLHQSSPASQIQVPDRDQIPHFIGKIYAGPLCLRRKKLVAAKSVYILNLDPPPSPVLDSASADPFTGVLNSDVLVAH